MVMRQYKGKAEWLVKAFSIAIMTYAVMYTFDIFADFGLIMMPVTYEGLLVGLFLCLTFILVAPTKKASLDKLPWYDCVLALMGLAGGGYVFLFYQERVLGSSLASPVEIFLFIGITIAILEAIRRTTSWVLVVVIGLFLLYTPFASYLPGILRGPAFSLPRITGYLFVFEGGIFGVIMKVISTVVLGYLVFAQLFYASGAGKILVDIAFSLFGAFRGGPAKGAIVASALFGSVSGSGSANVATTGMVTIPLMKKVGYSSEFAGAVEAVASTGGGIMPPVMGATAFVLAEFLRITYREVIILAAWPAVLYYMGLLVQVHFEAVRLGLRGLPREQLPSARRALSEGWHFAIPITVLLFFLVFRQANPITACSYAILSLIAVSFFRKEGKLGPRAILKSFDETTKSLLNIIAIGAGAGIIVGSLGLTGLGVRLSQLLVVAAGGNAVILVIMAGMISILLGTGLPWISCYILLALLVAPALVSMGLNEIAVHFFLLFMGVAAHLTPPVCITTFVAATIAESKPFATGWLGMRLGIVAYVVPFMFVFKPALILQGTVMEVVLALITSGIGVIILSCAVEGFLLKRCNWLQRIALFIGAILMIMPGWSTDVAGTAIFVMVGVWQWSSIERVSPISVRETG